MFYLLVMGVALGYYLDNPFIGICAVLAGYIGWHWLQLYRLNQWLEDGQSSLLPRTLGIWGSVFTQTQRLQQRSIKNQQQLQGVINRIQDSTAALKDAVMMVDSTGALEFWNQAAEGYLGLRHPVDLGQPITNLIRTPEFKSYFEQADYREPLVIKSPVNPQLSLQFNITLFGRRDRLILVHDITRLKQLEQMRKDFVANVSHELRTPLTVISGYVETMQMGADMLPPRWARMLQQMNSQSHRMGNLIKDLLMLSQLETSQAKDEQSIDVEAMLQSIETDARALSNGRHQVNLVHADKQRLTGNYNEIRSAFSNLVFNAVKYTPDGGTINIEWRQTRHGGCMSVKDNGIGIAAHHVPRLTERFYRADPSRSIETGGTGLGLAIVKHVLLHHQGELKIESEEGKGSTFSCVFPLKRMTDGVADATSDSEQ